MNLTTNYLVRVQTVSEVTIWITAETPIEAQLLAEARFKASGRRDFKIAEEEIATTEIADSLQFAGTA